MRKLLSAVDRQDAFILLGIASLGFGAGLAYLPAGFIAVGVTLLVLAVWRM